MHTVVIWSRAMGVSPPADQYWGIDSQVSSQPISTHDVDDLLDHTAVRVALKTSGFYFCRLDIFLVLDECVI